MAKEQGKLNLSFLEPVDKFRQLNDYYKQGNLDIVKAILKRAIHKISTILSDLLGISSGSRVELFYRLLGSQFARLIGHLRLKLFNEPDLQLVLSTLADQCTPSLQAHIEGFMERASIVKGIPIGKLRVLTDRIPYDHHRKVSSYGHEFSERLDASIRFSYTKLAIMDRIFKDKELRLNEFGARNLTEKVLSMTDEDLEATPYSTLIARF